MPTQASSPPLQTWSSKKGNKIDLLKYNCDSYNLSPASLYRGIIPPILVEAPKRATKFAANEQYTVLYKKMFGFEKVTQSLSVLTGVSAGITEACLIVPFELVKVRMQDKSNVRKMSNINKMLIIYSLVNIMVLWTRLEKLFQQKVPWLYSMD